MAVTAHSSEAEAEALRNYELFCTDDPRIAERGTTVFTSPHRLTPQQGGIRFEASARYASAGSASLCVVRYGAEVVIDRPGNDEHLAVLVPLAGRILVRHHNQEFVASSESSAIVLSPGLGRVRMKWDAGTFVMALMADTAGLSQALKHLAPHAGTEPFHAASTQMDGSSVRPILGTAQLLADVFSRYGPDHQVPPLLAKQIREQALSTLLLAVPSNHTGSILASHESAATWSVREVMDLIAAEPGADFTVSDLAREVGVGVRALELGFRRELDETPRSYLLRTRMESAHEELRNARPGDVTVTEVAMKWGFAHLGRFAARYRQRFGVLPSVTLGEVHP